MAELQEFKYHVVMTCGGCSGAIDRVLKKAKGAFVLHLHLPTSIYIP